MNLMYYTCTKLDPENQKFYVIKGFNYLRPRKPGAVTAFKIGDIVSVSYDLCTAHNRSVPKDYFILEPYIDEEELSMSRRVGDFVNPQTGETDWLEPDTVELIVLQPTMVIRVGETIQTPIDFKLNNDNAEHIITITAKYTANGTTYNSNPVPMDEEEFANQFAQQVYSDKALDEAEIVKQAKDTTVRDLSRRLMDNNVLIGGMKLKGLGFVLVDGDKVMTIDELEFEYAVENNKGIKTVVLKNCVGNASLQNLANPEIRFYTESHTINCIHPEVVDMVEGRLKDYTIHIEDILVQAVSVMPEHDEFSKVDINNEDQLSQFINNRKAMLDDNLDNTEENIEDRLGDLI